MIRALLLRILILATLLVPSTAQALVEDQRCFPRDPKALIVLPDFSKQECQNFDSILYLLKQAVNLMIGLVLTVALIFLLITGYQFATSLGNKQGMEEAKRSLLYIVIGVVVVLSAFMVVRFLTDQYLR